MIKLGSAVAMMPKAGPMETTSAATRGSSKGIGNLADFDEQTLLGHCDALKERKKFHHLDTESSEVSKEECFARNGFRSPLSPSPNLNCYSR